MKKEVVIAILIGLSLGLFITYGIYQARTGISDKSSETDLTLSPADSETTGELILNSPADESVQNENTVSVSGTTIPNSFVIIFVGDLETITTADASGNFSVEAKLKNGANIITVSVLNEDGRMLSVERTVVVSDEVFTEASDSASVQGQ